MESGLASIEKSSLMVISYFFGGRCVCVIIPRMALWDLVWMLIARSVNARDCGSYMPRPPFFKLSCDIRRKCCGRFSKFSNVAIKLEVI